MIASPSAGTLLAKPRMILLGLIFPCILTILGAFGFEVDLSLDGDFVKQLMSKVSNTFAQCSAFEIVFDSRTAQLLNEDWARAFNNDVTNEPVSASTPHLIIPELEVASAYSETYTVNTRAVKYKFMCTLVVLPQMKIDVSDKRALLHLRQTYTNFVDTFHNPMYSFFILLMEDTNVLENGLLELYTIATTAFPKKFFLIQKPKEYNQIIDVYATRFNSAPPFKQIGSFSSGTLTLNTSLYPFAILNFEREEVKVLICTVCDGSIDRYLRTGMWDILVMFATYETLNRYNASLKSEAVFGMPLLEPDENGDWGEFQQPLIDGTAGVTTFTQAIEITQALFLITRPITYERASFIVGPPKLAKFESFGVLKEPFNDHIWLSIFISLAFIMVALQAAIYFREPHRRICKFENLFCKILEIMLRPTLDQGPLVGTGYEFVSKNGYVNWLVGVWTVTLIVMSCLYKSKLISSIVCPRFIMPPMTFQELAESDFGIGAVFYTGGIDKDLLTTNSSVTMAIWKRVVEYDYLLPDCYHNIFDSDVVCLGYSLAFEGIGLEFIVDIHGRDMSHRSKDSHFLKFTTSGISKHYRMLHETVDSYLSIAERSGLAGLYMQYHTDLVKRRGVFQARQWVAINPIYKGFEEEFTKAGNSYITKLLFQLLTWGSVLSVLVLLVEIIFKAFLNFKTRAAVKVVQVATDEKHAKSDAE